MCFTSFRSCRLEAGKAYYVEVLQKQKRNQDHVEVAVSFYFKKILSAVSADVRILGKNTLRVAASF